jgi:uncharacterized protein (TIGR03083 family)
MPDETHPDPGNSTTRGVEAVVAMLDEVWASLAEVGSSLSRDEWELPTACPGWSVRDQFSHVIGTERMLLGESPPPLGGDKPPHVKNVIGEMNERWISERRDLPGAEVLAEFVEVTRRRLAELRAFPAERFDQVGPSPVGEVPYREFMAVRVMDCWVHEQDVRVATSRPGHKEGPAADLAIDRLVAAMPFVVAKRAAALDGQSVLFEIGGATPRRVVVAVSNGRGSLDASEPASSRAALEADDAPRPEASSTGDRGTLDRDTLDRGRFDAVISMDSEAFWQLACGRAAPEEVLARSRVSIGGSDEGLARRVLSSMAFMP